MGSVTPGRGSLRQVLAVARVDGRRGKATRRGEPSRRGQVSCLKWGEYSIQGKDR